MRAHGVKQKPPVCARVRVPIMNMYGSFCGRYVRVLFAPRDSCVRARSKDAAHLPFSLHPPLSHTCIFPPSFRSISLSLCLSFARSFYSPIFIPAYVDYATVSSVSYRSTVFSYDDCA